MGLPEDELDGVAIQGSTWSAADFGPHVDLPLAISERISYRFPFPRQTGEVTVPILVTMPDTDVPFLDEPGAGFPVIIYQPALTQDRSAILPMAVAAGLLCAGDDDVDDCFVTVAIDPPLHGIFPGFEGAVSDAESEDNTSGNPGMFSVDDQRENNPENSRPGDATRERHFGFGTNDAMKAVPASTLDEPGSGDLFLNFTNFANTQGNIRQSVMDALNLNASLTAIADAIAACVSCDDSFGIDTSRVYFLTHSLSGMGGVAVPHLTNLAIEAGNEALNPIQGQAFMNTGGHFSRVLENSRDLAPELLPGLDDASEGLLAQGRTELNLYLNILQGILDQVDPANYAASYSDTDTMLTAIVGDGTLDNCASMEPERVTADCTVPNAADRDLFLQGPLDLADLMLEDGTVFPIQSLPAPLAGTDPLARLMGAGNVLNDDSGRPFISLFSKGAHGNPISAGQGDQDPGSSEDVFSIMAIQMLQTFQGEDPDNFEGRDEEGLISDEDRAAQVAEDDE
ncbi:MAG: hypothetical protein EA349_11360 [Halomonadaceae bacterium]|nr:MAG: hypothetical protein EA349_11360 [Halomonadaceae bacterium]